MARKRSRLQQLGDATVGRAVKTITRRKPRRGPAGAPPGTITVDPSAPAPELHLIAFDGENIEERSIESVDELAEERGEWPVVWVNVDGLGDADLIGEIGDKFGLHPLALEDVVHAHQRAKVEEYPDHLFIVARMVTGTAQELAIEQLGMFLGEDFVLTFQERKGDCLDPVRERLRTGRGRLRSQPPDYLAYAIIDALIDAYFPIIEGYGDRLEELESHILTDEVDDDYVVESLHEIRRHLLQLRRAAWPLRDAVSALMRDGMTLVSDDTRVFLRDVYDHAIQIVDLLENYREIASGLMDVHFSVISNRMNEVMKVLTIIATVFMPLSFVAGVYGMNFNPDVSRWNMPELGWTYGYPYALGLMTLIVVGLLVFFRRRKWI